MPKWTNEQQLAIDKENSNIIVSASAGSGKTAVLTERVIKKLKKGIKIDQLLILTFTKAAAKEMKERIKDGIIKEGLTENLKLLNKAYITTFDSYALSIVRKYHYVINMSPNVSIEESGILKIQTKKIIDHLFNEYYLKKDEKFEKFIKDFCLKDDDDLKKLLLNLYEKIYLKIDFEEYLNTYIDNYYSDLKINNDINEFNNILLLKINEIKKLRNNLINCASDDYINKIDSILNPLFESNNYDEIKSNLIVSLPQIPRNSNQELKNIKEMIAKKIKELTDLCNFDNVEQMKELILSTKSNCEIIIKILIDLNNKLDIFKDKNQLYSFTDIAKKAIQILEQNEYIRDELKNYFNEIMIDEYQDTSDVQEAFIKLIENNNVYMVGDIKQSIYRFRNANPYIFKNKYDSYKNNCNGFKIDLSKNFRSRQEVISNINTLFDCVMDDQIGGADYKNEHEMIYGNTAYIESGNNFINNNLEILNYSCDKELKYTREEIEIFTIANDIKKKVSNKYPVMDKKTNQIRSITYNDFVILLGKSKDFTLYKKIFEYLNIPLSIKRDENLLSNKNINLIRNLCELVILYKNKIFDSKFKFDFMSVARSYLFEIDDSLLFKIIKDNNYSCEIKDLLNEMLTYIDESIYIFLDHLFNKTNIYEKIIKIGNIEENLLVLDYIKSLGETLSNMGYNLNDFVEYLTDLKEQGLDLKYSVADNFTNSVKIMTIHGSKGLEFPICYYASLSSKFNIKELNEKILFSDRIVLPYVNKYYRKTIYYYILKNNYINEEISEQIRLFYVALTRAREKMIIVASLTDKNELKDNNIVLDRLNYKSFNDILCSIKDKIDEYIVPINIEQLNIDKKYKYGRKINYNCTTETKFDIEDLIFEQDELVDKNYSKNQDHIISKEENDRLNVGIKFHSILEYLDFKNPIIDESLPEFYVNKIKSFISLNIFKQDIINTYKEYEFIYDNKIGIIDLIVETNDKLIVIDYKLKEINDNAYVSQLNGYKEYLKTISSKKIELYLYSILDEKLLKIN